MMLFNLALGAGMTALTVGVHAMFMDTAIYFSRGKAEDWAAWRILVMVGVVLWFFFAICVECWLWALLFLWVGTVPDLESAVYFATVTYTTLGYGDIVLDEDWRMLSAFAAGNGVIVIGWTTAIVYFVAQRVYMIGIGR